MFLFWYIDTVCPGMIDWSWLIFHTASACHFCGKNIGSHKHRVLLIVVCTQTADLSDPSQLWRKHVPFDWYPCFPLPAWNPPFITRLSVTPVHHYQCVQRPLGCAVGPQCVCVISFAGPAQEEASHGQENFSCVIRVTEIRAGILPVLKPKVGNKCQKNARWMTSCLSVISQCSNSHVKYIQFTYLIIFTKIPSVVQIELVTKYK